MSHVSRVSRVTCHECHVSGRPSRGAARTGRTSGCATIATAICPTLLTTAGRWGYLLYLHNFYISTDQVATHTGDSLTLANLNRFQSGVYLCIANNQVPPSVSKRVQVSTNCYIMYKMSGLSWFEVEKSFQIDTSSYFMKTSGKSLRIAYLKLSASNKTKPCSIYYY